MTKFLMVLGIEILAWVLRRMVAAGRMLGKLQYGLLWLGERIVGLSGRIAWRLQGLDPNQYDRVNETRLRWQAAQKSMVK